jgi:hypothetical protein
MTLFDSFEFLLIRFIQPNFGDNERAGYLQSKEFTANRIIFPGMPRPSDLSQRRVLLVPLLSTKLLYVFSHIQPENAKE